MHVLVLGQAFDDKNLLSGSAAEAQSFSQFKRQILFVY